MPATAIGAPPFARGAVELLAASGVVTHLSFGSEGGDVEALHLPDVEGMSGVKWVVLRYNARHRHRGPSLSLRFGPSGMSPTCPLAAKEGTWKHFSRWPHAWTAGPIKRGAHRPEDSVRQSLSAVRQSGKILLVHGAKQGQRPPLVWPVCCPGPTTIWAWSISGR